MSIEIWIALLGTALLISLSPGASAATAMGAGLTYGTREACWSTLGLVCGYGIQILVVSLGLGGLIATSPKLFALIKWIGVAYLVWLGIRFWCQRHTGEVESLAYAPRYSRFLQGLLVNLTNPKGLLFLLALIPQFLDPNTPQLPQLIIISTTLMGAEACIMTGYSGLAARLRQRLSHPLAVLWQQRLAGSALITAGLVLSVATL